MIAATTSSQTFLPMFSNAFFHHPTFILCGREYSSATTTGFIIEYNFNVEFGISLNIWILSLLPNVCNIPPFFVEESTIGFVIGHNISMWKMGFSLKWVLSHTSTKIQKKERSINTHDIRVAA
jgi:hypothetical protein